MKLTPSYLFTFSWRRTYPPSSNGCSADTSEHFSRSDTTLDGPVIDVSYTEIARVVDVTDGLLPSIFLIRLPIAGALNIHLLDRESMLTRHSDIMAIAICAHASEVGGMMGEDEI